MPGQGMPPAANLHGGPGKMHRLPGMPEKLSVKGNHRRTQETPLYQPGTLHEVRGLLFEVQV